MNKPSSPAIIPICVAAGIYLMAIADAALGADNEGWISFDGSEGRIALSGIVNGEPARVLIDSSANASVISSDFAERADIRTNRLLEFEVGGKYRDQRIIGSRRFELEIGDLSLSFNGLPVLPTDRFDMVLGNQIFEDAVVQIDYPGQRLRFLPAEAVSFEGNTPARQGSEGSLEVEVRIQGHTAWLMLNTGLSGPTLLTRDFVIDNDLEGKRLKTYGTAGEDGNDSDQTLKLKLDDVELGPYRFEQFLARYSSNADQAMDIRRSAVGTRIRQGRARYDGMLGHEVLGNFLITADFSSGKLHLHLP